MGLITIYYLTPYLSVAPAWGILGAQGINRYLWSSQGRVRHRAASYTCGSPPHTPLQASQSLSLFDMCLILCPLSRTGSHTDPEQVSALFSKKPVLSDQSPTRGGLPIGLIQRLFTSQLHITDG